MNICFFSGTIVTKPEFKFFYNSKKFVSKVSFMIQTETGFKSSRNLLSEQIKVVAYDDNADFIYKNCELNDSLQIQGFLYKDLVVAEFFKWKKGEI